MELINLMPMLIFHCRTRLFLAFIQQRALLGGTPTLRLQEQPMNYTLISHQDSIIKKKYPKKKKCQQKMFKY